MQEPVRAVHSSNQEIMIIAVAGIRDVTNTQLYNIKRVVIYYNAGKLNKCIKTKVRLCMRAYIYLHTCSYDCGSRTMKVIVVVLMGPSNDVLMVVTASPCDSPCRLLEFTWRICWPTFRPTPDSAADPSGCVEIHNMFVYSLK